MRVTYIHQYFNTPSMAGSSRSYEMARRLVAMGHEVNLITSARDSVHQRTGWRVTNESGINVYWCSVPYSNHMGFYARIKSFLIFAYAASIKAAQLKSDVVFATSTPLTIIIPGLYASFRQNVKLVFEVRDMWPAVPIEMGLIKNPIIKAASKLLERIAYRRAHHIVALAPGMRDDICALGIDNSKVSVIPNGCDVDIFGSHDEQKKLELLRKNRFLSTGGPTLLFAGTLGKANGVDYLAKIASVMKNLSPTVKFVVIGSGAEEKHIASMAKDLCILDINFFMIPSMPKNELSTWFSFADMTFGLFSGPRVLWKDAVQNKFFDSLAAGKPVACNFVGYQSEIAVENGVGVIIPADDPVEAAHVLFNKLNDKVWLNDSHINSKRLANSVFSRDILANKLERILTASTI